MRITPSLLSEPVLRTPVVLCIPWGGVCWAWWIWKTHTLRYPLHGEPPVLILLEHGPFLSASALNLGLLAWLLFDWRRTASSPRGMRLGHRAGIGLAVLGLALLQVGLVLARGPIELA